MNRTFESYGENNLPRRRPGFMLVVGMGKRSFGKIDPTEEKRRNGEKQREIKRETSLYSEFFFNHPKNQRRFPLWLLYHNNASLGGEK